MFLRKKIAAKSSGHPVMAELDGFFDRAKKVARKLDAGEMIDGTLVFKTNDPAQVSKVLTASRWNLLKAMPAEPTLLVQIVADSGRNRTAVLRDIQALSDFGVVEMKKVANKGHGQQIEVTKKASRIALELVVDPAAA